MDSKQENPSRVLIILTKLNNRSFTAHFARYFFFCAGWLLVNGKCVEEESAHSVYSFCGVNVYMLAVGGQYNGRCGSCLSLLSIPGMPKNNQGMDCRSLTDTFFRDGCRKRKEECQPL